MTTRAADLITGRAWAIEPEALQTIIAVAERVNGSPEAVAAQLGRPLQNARNVTERAGSAIVPITGPIFRRANLLTEISGATSVEVLAQDLRTAADDPRVERIVLEIDSPGGEATGIAELAGQIRAIDKPVVAYVDGSAASAAYWLAAAADQIVAAPTALLGSIGVVGTYRPEKDGPIKIISTISPLKQATPETEAGRAEAQRIVDELAAVFVADIAAYRNTTPEAVAAGFGRGGVLVGAAAVAAGMADAIGTFESLFQAGSPGATNRGITMSDNPSPEITRETLAAEHPALLSEIESAAQQIGINAERERVAAITTAAAASPHARTVADAAITQGLSAEQASAMIAAVPEPLRAEPDDASAREDYRAALLEEGRQQAADASTAAGDIAADPDQAARADWDSNAKLRSEFGNDFDRYAAYQRATSSGRVKVLRGAKS
jgi:ClpP class serine protease